MAKQPIACFDSMNRFSGPLCDSCVTERLLTHAVVVAWSLSGGPSSQQLHSHLMWNRVILNCFFVLATASHVCSGWKCLIVICTHLLAISLHHITCFVFVTSSFYVLATASHHPLHRIIALHWTRLWHCCTLSACYTRNDKKSLQTYSGIYAAFFLLLEGYREHQIAKLFFDRTNK